jgi:hypothetical protein
LDRVLNGVAVRRCASCHPEGKVPRAFYTRITNPQENAFLLAPLAKAAGGTERCGQATFLSADDPDYQAVLRTFEPALRALEARPRLDITDAASDGGPADLLGSR